MSFIVPRLRICSLFRHSVSHSLQLFLLVAGVAVLLLPKNLHADNPMVPDVGMADPHIRIFDGKAYLYATRDESPTAKTFMMPDWHIWSSDDLIHWKHDTTILPTETYMGESKRCWATDTVEYNGQYYFYFSNGNVDTGVMTGPTPVGPFVDTLGKPMLSKDLTIIKEYDPTVLVDDDNSAYIVVGHHRQDHPDFYWAISRLNEDMVSLAEPLKELIIDGDMEVLQGNDKPNLHKYLDTYYLSAGSHYGTSKNVYGPYTRRGNSGNDDYGLTARAHGNYFEWNGQWFHTWCHFHLGKDTARFRESYISYLHYRENGEMITDTRLLDAHFAAGVGQYDVYWKSIEAEWFMSVENCRKLDAKGDNFVVSPMGEKAILRFPNVANLNRGKSLILECEGALSGRIDIYAIGGNRQLLGGVELSQGTASFVEIPLISLPHCTGIEIVLSNCPESMEIDRFSFVKY